jgi:hypothetical protein
MARAGPCFAPFLEEVSLRHSFHRELAPVSALPGRYRFQEKP